MCLTIYMVTTAPSFVLLAKLIIPECKCVLRLRRRRRDRSHLSRIRTQNYHIYYQNIINVHADLKMTKVVFSATSETFSGDPWQNSTKAFSMVRRELIRLDYGNLYSASEKLFAEED